MLKPLLLALLALPVYHRDDKGPEKQRQLELVAESIAAEAKTLEEAAMVSMLGHYESAYSLDVHNGKCRPKQCDPDSKGVHRARSPFQLHRNGLDQETWDRMIGVENTRFQVREAVRRVRSAFATCKGSPDPVKAAIAQYAGAGCKGFAKVKRGRERVEAYYRIRGRIP